MGLQQLVEDFALLDDWEEKYSYIIDLGRSLPAIDPTKKDDAHKVPGCVSSIWLDAGFDSEGRVRISADSDALIVRGFIALMAEIFNGLTREQALKTDAIAAFEEMGISSHITPNRRSGIAGVVARIKLAASAA